MNKIHSQIVVLVSFALFFASSPAYSKVNWVPLDLSFSKRFSEIVTMPYPRHDGSKNGGSRERFYFLRKDGKPYTIEQGTCSVIGQNESPAGGFTYKLFLNKKGIWIGYIFSNHWPRGGILVQCIES